MFVEILQCRPAKEQDEIHLHPARRKGFRRFHRNTAISAPSASATHQHSANPRDGNRILLNFNRVPEESHMTDCPSSSDDENVLFRGPPLQRVSSGGSARPIRH